MVNFISKHKGQITFLGILIPAIATVLAAWGGSWATSANTANNRIGATDTKIQVVEERENNHFLELTKKVEGIDKKLDILIGKIK